MIGFMLTIVGMFSFLVVRQTEFHHDHRSDGYAVDHTAFPSFATRSSITLVTIPLASVRTVIGCNIEIACHFLKFLFQDHQVFCLCTDDNICINAVLMQPFYLWIYRCSTYTACYKKDLLLFYFFEIFCAQAQTAVPEDLQNHRKASPAFSVANFSVDAPIGWNTIVTVPASLS